MVLHVKRPVLELSVLAANVTERLGNALKDVSPTITVNANYKTFIIWKQRVNQYIQKLVNLTLAILLNS